MSGYKTELYFIEKNFDQAAFHVWLGKNWSRSIWYALLYVVLVIVGPRLMAKREKFSLRAPLTLWSGSLALFSIAGAVRTYPELIHTMRRGGFEATVCDDSVMYGDVSYWVHMFVMSKLYELGDTVFIILRKQRLVFLHWYHHATVLIYVWFTVSMGTAPGRWFMVMNYTVHSVMYTYYALRAMGVRPPRWINMGITTMQICQMMMGLVVVLKVYQVKSQGRNCQLQWGDWFCCLTMYGSYFILFVYFFYQSYLTPKTGVDKKLT